jgi:hypothetical protein
MGSVKVLLLRWSMCTFLFRATRGETSDGTPFDRPPTGAAASGRHFESNPVRDLKTVRISRRVHRKSQAGTYWPGNVAQGFVAHASTVVLLDDATGFPLAVLGASDAPCSTARDCNPGPRGVLACVACRQRGWQVNSEFVTGSAVNRHPPASPVRPTLRPVLPWTDLGRDCCRIPAGKHGRTWSRVFAAAIEPLCC